MKRACNYYAGMILVFFFLLLLDVQNLRERRHPTKVSTIKGIQVCRYTQLKYASEMTCAV